MESIVSITLFALMGVMFSTFMFTSTKMVEMSLVFDEDRERIVEAIESGNTSSLDGITLTVVNEDTDEYQSLLIELKSADNQLYKRKVKDGTYYIYSVGSSNVRYCIYVGNET